MSIGPGQALILGAVEGLTEFLPVSSTGHLILVSHWLGLEGEAVKTFEVVIQAGALGAVLVLYRRSVAAMWRGLRGQDPEGRRLLWNLAVSFLPAAIVGLALHKAIKATLFSLGPVVAALALGGVVMIGIDRWLRSRGRPTRALASLTARDALLIGLAQCLSLWPGTSRAMVTLVAGLLVGLPATAAAEYSFLLALPTLGAATLFDAARGGGELLLDAGALSIVCGFATAGVIAALAIKGLIQYLTRRGLAPFGWYRLGLAVGIWLFVWPVHPANGIESARTDGTGDWQAAETRWVAFANEHMERMKHHDLTTPRARRPDYQFDMEWVEVKNGLIARYLPRHRIFADRRFVFALDKKGHILCLGNTWPLRKPFETAPDFEVKSFSEFVRSLGIFVANETSAIELAQLKEIISDRKGDIELARQQGWRYSASRKDRIWTVQMHYVGPSSVSTMEPPVWKIEVDQSDRVQTIREFQLGFCDVNGDGDCNAADVESLENLIGKCLTVGRTFNSIADVDGDGCITEKDRDLLLKTLSDER